jgi:uncharacterized protein
MHFVISPAKSLDYETPAHIATSTQPLFIKESAALVKGLKKLSSQELRGLMHISEPLAVLNAERFNSKQAVLAFDGDVYDGLNAKSLSAKQLDWAQAHVSILSGLYGVLRPLDLMQAYRLEMGTHWENPRGKDLYAYWGSKIAQQLNAAMSEEKTPLLVNLASQEYFKSVNLKALKARVIECRFEERKAKGEYKVVSFSAKRARGMMLRFAIEHQATEPEQLRAFAEQGYSFVEGVSTQSRYIFHRVV